MLRLQTKAVIVAMAITLISGSACGMTTAKNEAGSCRVVGGGKLPAESGGPSALCAAVKRAAAAKAPRASYQVEVRVLSPSRLAATVKTGDGRVLPELNHAISDSNLTRKSFERFADAIAAELAKTASR